MNDIIIRAISTDNNHDLVRLVALLSSQEGPNNKYTVDALRQFSAETPDDSTTPTRRAPIHLVAMEGDQCLAHIAIVVDRLSRSAELVLPAIKRGYRKSLCNIARLFWDHLQLLGERQGWSFLYQYTPASEPLMQLIGHRFLHASDLAIIPPTSEHSSGESQKIGLTRPREGQGFVLLSNVLRSGRGRQQALFPPLHRLEEVRRLYYPLFLKRRFVNETTPQDHSSRWFVDNFGNEAARLPSNQPYSYEQSPFARLAMLKIIPSAIDGSVKATTADASTRARDVGFDFVILVALNDPDCPQVSEELESLGYTFSGIFPLLDNNDYILYTRFSAYELSRMTLYSESARQLQLEMLSEKEQAHVSDSNLTLPRQVAPAAAGRGPGHIQQQGQQKAGPYAGLSPNGHEPAQR